ncbi:MAG: hypothetical protein GY845_25855 [Planctomycetes bacterium]|nr:hypothetical protein [Planctomycetota bacterium]
MVGNLGLLTSAYVKGCSTLTTEEGRSMFRNPELLQHMISLGDVLNAKFETAVPFTCYQVTGLPRWPRLNKPILPEIREQGQDVVMTHFAFDYDTGEGDDHIPWTDESFNPFVELVKKLTHPLLSKWAALYTTIKGARFIYQLSQPIPVDIAESNLTWMINEFHNAGFTNIDTSCKDWTRLFFCPRIVKDGQHTDQGKYFSVDYRPEAVIDIGELGELSPRTVAVKREFNVSKAKMPMIPALENYLQITNRQTGRKKATAFYKRAKKALIDSGSPYIDILFDDVPPYWENRNNEICKMLGNIVPILLHKTRADINQIFALVINPVQTLDTDQNWPVHTWGALVDIYARETTKFNVIMSELAEKESVKLDSLDRIVRGMQKWSKDPDIHAGGETAREAAKKKLFAVDGIGFFIMGKNGQYINTLLRDRQIITSIRDCHLNNIIETTREIKTGETIDVSAPAIINKYGTTITHIEYRITMNNLNGFLEYPDNNDFASMVLSLYRRNPLLTPTYDPVVDAWLAAFGGVHYKAICKWIANALAFEEGTICALSIKGSPSIGKQLLIRGLAECLEKPTHATGIVLEEQSSALMHTPFLNINEEWPWKMTKRSPTEAFKVFVGGDMIEINEKFQPIVHIYNPVRLIMTANNMGLVEKILNSKELSLDDRTAIGLRLFHVDLDNTGAIFLESIGNNATTAKPGASWIKPEGSANLQTEYKVAKHFLWLHANREKSEGPMLDRLLMMGNCGPGHANQDMITKILTNNPNTALVCRACIGMADSQSEAWRTARAIPKDMDKLYVTKDGINRYISEVLEEKRMHPNMLVSALMSITNKSDPQRVDGLDWYEMDVALLCTFANEQGIKSSLIRTLYVNAKRKEQGI